LLKASETKILDRAIREDSGFLQAGNAIRVGVGRWTRSSLDSFEADRAPASLNAAGAPTHGYRTMNLAGIFVRERALFMNPQDKGHFCPDGRFLTLLDTVKSYKARFDLVLSDQEQHDLVEYLKSL